MANYYHFVTGYTQSNRRVKFKMESNNTPYSRKLENKARYKAKNSLNLKCAWYVVQNSQKLILHNIRL